jgi:hypothetical protein
MNDFKIPEKIYLDSENIKNFTFSLKNKKEVYRIQQLNKEIKMKKNGVLQIAVILLLLCNSKVVFCHTSTLYEPEVIANAKKAIELNDVNYALKLVKPDDKKVPHIRQLAICVTVICLWRP